MKNLVDYYKEQFQEMSVVSLAASVLYKSVVDLVVLDQKINEAVQNEDSDSETLIELSKTLCNAMELSTKLAGELICKKLIEERIADK